MILKRMNEGREWYLLQIIHQGCNGIQRNVDVPNLASSSPRRSALSWSIELHVNVYLISMEGDIRLGRVIPSISSPGTDLMEGYCRRHI